MILRYRIGTRLSVLNHCSFFLSGNKSRNQQIREDLPQAKEAQFHELQEAQQREYEHRY